jgi:hypothetical protein
LENNKILSQLQRFLPGIMIWGSQTKLYNIPAPKNLMYVGRGVTPVATMRTSWTDANAIYVGLKGGKASTSHSQADAGSFIMEADGVRWASDPNVQSYGGPELNKIDLWNFTQNSTRWTLFRTHNRSHNTLTVDDQLHVVDGTATIRSSSSKANFMNVITDLSAVFEGQLASARRGVAIINKQYVTVRDEVKTLDKETTIRWSLFTEAQATLKENNCIELVKNGKKLVVEVVQPANITLKTWSTTPANKWEDRNDGTMLVGFEVLVPANTETAIVVKLVPQSAGKTEAKVPELSKWAKDKQ